MVRSSSLVTLTDAPPRISKYGTGQAIRRSWPSYLSDSDRIRNMGSFPFVWFVTFVDSPGTACCYVILRRPLFDAECAESKSPYCMCRSRHGPAR